MTLADPRGALPRTVVMVRTLAAPAARVYAAWTESALLARWMAPAPYRVLEAETDPRPGGIYRVKVVGPEGDEHLTTGEFVELVPDRRIVQSWLYEGAFGRDVAPTRLTVELRALGPELTELTLTHDRIPDTAPYAHLDEGWRECLVALEALLDEPYVHVRVTRQLAASPERVFDAWVDPDVVGRWMAGTGDMVRVAIDARPGGTFRLVVRRDGEDVVHEGEYVELERPHRLSFTWVLPQFSEERDLVRVTLAPADGGSALTLVHRIRAEWAAYADRTASAWGKLLDVIDAATA